MNQARAFQDHHSAIGLARHKHRAKKPIPAALDQIGGFVGPGDLPPNAILADGEVFDPPRHGHGARLILRYIRIGGLMFIIDRQVNLARLKARPVHIVSSIPCRATRSQDIDDI